MVVYKSKGTKKIEISAREEEKESRKRVIFGVGWGWIAIFESCALALHKTAMPADFIVRRHRPQIYLYYGLSNKYNVVVSLKLCHIAVAKLHALTCHKVLPLTTNGYNNIC